MTIMKDVLCILLIGYQPLPHNWYIKDHGRYYPIGGLMHIKDLFREEKITVFDNSHIPFLRLGSSKNYIIY